MFNSGELYFKVHSCVNDFKDSESHMFVISIIS